MEVRCAKALEQLCQTRAKIVGRPDNLINIKKIASEAVMSKLSEVSMSISPTKPDAQVEHHLNSLCNESLIKVMSKKLELGSIISCTHPLSVGDMNSLSQWTGS